MAASERQTMRTSRSANIKTVEPRLGCATRLGERGPTLLRVRRRVPLAAILTCGLIAPLFTPAQAQNTDALDDAKSFLGARATGRAVLTALHLGSTYLGHKPTGGTVFRDRYFDLSYRYDWYSFDPKDPGWTDVVFHCDPYGNVKGVDTRSNAGPLNRPFLIANGATWFVGHEMADAFEKWIGPEKAERYRDIIQWLAEGPDARKVLESLLEVKWLDPLIFLRRDLNDR